MEKVLVIEGMSCNHCKMRVENALSALAGVESVSVDLTAKTATLMLTEDIASSVLTEVIDDAGYDLIEIK
jgi:copper chaperone CopZ